MKEKHLKLIAIALAVLAISLAYRQNIPHAIAFSAFTPPDSMLEHYTAYHYKYDEAFENKLRVDELWVHSIDGYYFGSTRKVPVTYETFDDPDCFFMDGYYPIDCYVFCNPVFKEYLDLSNVTQSISEFNRRWPDCDGQVIISKLMVNTLFHTWWRDVTPIEQKANELTQGISDKWEKAQKIMEYVHSIPYPSKYDFMVPEGDVAFWGAEGYYGWWYPVEVVTGEQTTADCKTKSTLLVALLRASGFSAEEVFSVATERHRYVVVKYNDKWLPVDPTNTDDFFQALKTSENFWENYDWNPDLSSVFGNDVYYYENSDEFKEIIRKFEEYEPPPI